jgi:hypothetical protein
MLMFARGVLNGQNDDLLARFVKGVVDQIWVFPVMSFRTPSTVCALPTRGNSTKF